MNASVRKVDMSEQELMVETSELLKVFGDGHPIHALNSVDLRVRRGEFVSIMGPSGSGKSTLLNMLGALDRPTSGKIVVDGRDLSTVKDLDRFRNQTIGFIFQLHNLIPTLNALENAEVPLYEQSVSASQRRQRALEMLELVGLGDRAKHFPHQLSGGERQRIAIARAMVNQPALILADEPTGELDSANSRDIIDLMRDLNHRIGTTIIIVTHDPAVARRTDRILGMCDGRIVREDLVSDPYTEDLITLRDSPLGQALLAEKADVEVNGLVLRREGRLTELGQAFREMLERLTARSAAP
jgi:ABC-type lipoprotein export system ATPase subunit